MKKFILFNLCFLFSFSIFARTDCSLAKILHIQIEGKKIMYQQEGSPWRTLGYTTNDDGTKERYSALLSAQMAGKKVIIGYSSNSYDCSITNYGTSALVVRTYN